MPIPRMTTRRVMSAIAIIAIDLAYLQQGVFHLYLLIAVPVLQTGLFWVVSSRGVIRPFWVGFEMFGWAGVIAFRLGVGTLWYRFYDGRINDVLNAIAHRRPDVARAVVTVLFCEGTPIQDTIPGLLPESLIAGMPILFLALIGGLIAACPVIQRGRLRTSPIASPEV